MENDERVNELGVMGRGADLEREGGGGAISELEHTDLLLSIPLYLSAPISRLKDKMSGKKQANTGRRANKHVIKKKHTHESLANLSPSVAS